MTLVELPGPAVAAAAEGETAWCAANGRLLGWDEHGSPSFDVDAPAGLGSLAAGGGTLAAALEPGIVAWLDGSSGKVEAQVPVGGEPAVLSGGDAVWVVDLASGQARRLAEAGTLAEPVSVGRADRLAPEGDRLWWTSPDDALLREGERTVDLGVGPGERGGLVGCSGSIWASVADGLLRVAAWAGELGLPLAAPEGPVEHLACASGILVGGSGRQGLFCLDPSVDADVRHLDVELGGELDHLVACRSVAWAFPADRPEARLVTVRLGE